MAGVQGLPQRDAVDLGFFETVDARAVIVDLHPLLHLVARGGLDPAVEDLGPLAQFGLFRDHLVEHSDRVLRAFPRTLGLRDRVLVDLVLFLFDVVVVVVSSFFLVSLYFGIWVFFKLSLPMAMAIAMIASLLSSNSSFHSPPAM